MNTVKNVNDTIKILEDKILGTPETTAKIISVESYGYMVNIDGDDPDWNGAVDFDGNILAYGCN